MADSTQSVPTVPITPGSYFVQLREAITGGPIDYVVGQFHIVKLLTGFPQAFLIAGYDEVFRATRVKVWAKQVPIPFPDAPVAPTEKQFPGF